jgi:hypothetical protein
MRHWQGRRLFACCLALCFAAAPAAAITIDIDYTYDTSRFFGDGNPRGAAAGAQAFAALEAAATFFSNILNDTFSGITVPNPYPSRAPGSNGVVTWSWDLNFRHPSTGTTIEIPNPTVVPNVYTIYAGARSLPGVTAGVGEVGGYGWASDISGSNSFTSSDITTIEQTTANFQSAIETRGESSGFANWGGAIAFDTNPGANWHFNHMTPPAGTVFDFYSVAIHELAHALGFGSLNSDSDGEWPDFVSGSDFVGANAMAQKGGNPVPLADDRAHWAPNTQSVIYGGSTPQEAAMDPDIQNGTRKLFTALDAAAMRDIGWEVIPLPGVHGDYNNNGVVDAADYVVWRDRLGQNVTIPNDMTPGNVGTGDYTVWRMNYDRTLGSGSGAVLLGVPEPAGIVIALIGVSILGSARRKRRR